MYDNRQFAIFSVDEIDKIDFGLVCESSPDTLRRSVDGTKTFVKWDGEVPDFVYDIETVDGPFTYEQMMEILWSAEWTPPYEEDTQPPADPVEE